MAKSKLPNWAKFLKSHDPLRPNMGIAHLRNGLMYITDGHILYRCDVDKFITSGKEFADGKALGLQVLEAMTKATSIVFKEETIELFNAKGELESVYYYVAKYDGKSQYNWFIETNGQFNFSKGGDGLLTPKRTPYLNIEVAIPTYKTYPYRFFPIDAKLLSTLCSLFIADNDRVVLRTNKKKDADESHINKTAIFVYPVAGYMGTITKQEQLGIIMPLNLSDASETELNDLVNFELGINQPTADILDV
jgi:hypothetical protein